jgi:hypothetical protein
MYAGRFLGIERAGVSRDWLVGGERRQREAGRCECEDDPDFAV